MTKITLGTCLSQPLRVMFSKFMEPLAVPEHVLGLHSFGDYLSYIQCDVLHTPVAFMDCLE